VEVLEVIEHLITPNYGGSLKVITYLLEHTYTITVGAGGAGGRLPGKQISNKWF
jgi:hypothetical protein